MTMPLDPLNRDKPLEVFLSYSWLNSAERLALERALEATGNCKPIFDRKDILLGHEVHPAIAELLKDCDCLVVLITKESLESFEVRDELTRAHALGKHIVPIVQVNIDMESLPWYLRDLRQIRYDPRDFDSVVREVEDFVKTLALAKSRSHQIPRDDASVQLNQTDVVDVITGAQGGELQQLRTVINRMEEEKNRHSTSSREWATLHHTQEDLESLFITLQERFRVLSASQAFSADSLFHSRSDMPKFELRLEQGENIWMSGITLRALQINYLTHIEDAVKQGRRFRLLLVDPDNTSALDMLAASTPMLYNADKAKNAIQEAIEGFERLARKPQRGTIEIRLLNSVPFSSIIIVDGDKPNGRMTVEMYAYQVVAGRRLHFELTRTRDPQTFTFYLNQFEKMWQAARSPNIQEE